MMPRTVQDILDHGDELAKRFEVYEPEADDQRDPAIFVALREAVLSRSEAERSVRQAVTEHARTATPGARLSVLLCVRSWRLVGVVSPDRA